MRKNRHEQLIKASRDEAEKIKALKRAEGENKDMLHEYKAYPALGRFRYNHGEPHKLTDFIDLFNQHPKSFEQYFKSNGMLKTWSKNRVEELQKLLLSEDQDVSNEVKSGFKMAIKQSFPRLAANMKIGDVKEADPEMWAEYVDARKQAKGQSKGESQAH